VAKRFEPFTIRSEKLQIHLVIDTVFPFADALAAYDHLYRGASGKIVIRVRE
jgi:NADPH:quinone reductase-like Zn-dependent oxidoreductase